MNKATVKCLSIVLVMIFMLQAFGSISAFALVNTESMEITVSQTSAQPGDDVQLTVQLQNNPGIASLKFFVTYDEVLTLKNVELSSEFGSYVTTAQPYKNPQSITLISPLSDIFTNGVLATMTFTVSEEAPDNYIANVGITYDQEDVYNGIDQPIELIVHNGYVKIFKGLPGDVDANGKVNTKDANALFRKVADWDVAVDNNALDVNGDGKINTKDAIALFRYTADWEGIEIGYGLGWNLPDVCAHELTAVGAKEATCTEVGNTKYWKCSKCGEYYSDSEAKTEISVSDVIIESNGHTPVTDPAVLPTCTEKGKTSGTHCSVCGDIIVSQEILDAIGHQYGEPTWTWTEHTAKAAFTCINNISHKEIISAVVTDEVTEGTLCTESGVHTYTATVEFNEHTYTDTKIEAVSAIGHNVVIDEAVAPNCVTPGLTAGSHCSVCNGVIVAQKVVSATGIHQYEHGEYGKCVNCDVEKLAIPVITKIEYDTVYWTPVKGGNYYTIRVNDNYECVMRGSSCALKNAIWNGNEISNHGLVKIEIKANGYDTYQSSDWSEENNTYYYIPESKSSSADTLSKYSIGDGYNLIEDDYLNTTRSKNSVFNIAKLLTVGKYVAQNNSTGGGSAYNYSSIDEFISKTKVSVEYEQEVGCVLLGSVKTQLNVDVGFNYSTYAYNNMYIYKFDVVYKDHKITNISDINLLKYCLSDDFLKDLRRESANTVDMRDEQLVAYLYNTYGTHAILGITTGGTYFAEYVISTNREDIAAAVSAAFKLSSGGGGAIDQIIQKDFNIGVSLDENLNWKSETTEAHSRVYYYGGNKGAATNERDISSAVSAWSGTLDEDHAMSIRFTKDGAISISSLLAMVDGSLASKYAQYVTERSDLLYKELEGVFSAKTNIPMVVTAENNKNTLKIDLSEYQSYGSMSNAKSPYLMDNILTVYPTMRGKSIDTIVIESDYSLDTGKKMIDELTIALSKEWDKDVNIIIRNVGADSSTSPSFIDTSAISDRINVNVSFEGINAVKKDGRCILYTEGEYAHLNHATYYNQLQSQVPKWYTLDDVAVSDKVVIDFRNTPDGENYFSSKGSNGDGDTYVDFTYPLKDLYLFGNPNASYHMNLILNSFESGSDLTIHLINFNLIGDIAPSNQNDNGTWSSFDKGMNLTIDVIGAHCSIKSNTGEAIKHFNNVIITGPGILNIFGSDGTNAASPGENGKNGSSAVIVDNLTVNMTGNLYVYGGNGGNGGNGFIYVMGGVGAEALNITKLTVSDGNVYLYGGNGGNGGTPGSGANAYSGSDVGKVYKNIQGIAGKSLFNEIATTALSCKLDDRYNYDNPDPNGNNPHYSHDFEMGKFVVRGGNRISNNEYLLAKGNNVDVSFRVNYNTMNLPIQDNMTWREISNDGNCTSYYNLPYDIGNVKTETGVIVALVTYEDGSVDRICLTNALKDLNAGQEVNIALGITKPCRIDIAICYELHMWAPGFLGISDDYWMNWRINQTIYISNN